MREKLFLESEESHTFTLWKQKLSRHLCDPQNNRCCWVLPGDIFFQKTFIVLQKYDSLENNCVFIFYNTATNTDWKSGLVVKLNEILGRNYIQFVVLFIKIKYINKLILFIYIFFLFSK